MVRKRTKMTVVIIDYVTCPFLVTSDFKRNKIKLSFNSFHVHTSTNYKP